MNPKGGGSEMLDEIGTFECCNSSNSFISIHACAFDGILKGVNDKPKLKKYLLVKLIP